jgi:hypothetical protein
MSVTGNTDLGQAIPTVSVVVAATDVKAIPLTAFVKYASPTTGLLTITHSGALTGVTTAFVTI